MFRVGLYLPSNVSDVHVRSANLAVERSVPKLFHDLLAAIDPSRMGSERLENLEFCSGQVYALVADPNLPTQKIDHEAGEHKSLIWSVDAPTPEVGTHATHYLQRADRLGDVVVCPHLETEYNASFAVARGQHDYRNVAAFPEFLTDTDTVDAREHYVQENQIERPSRSKAVQRRFTVRNRFHAQPLALEGDLHYVSYRRIVFDD